MRKREIVKELNKMKERIDEIIDGFGKIGEDDPTVKRHAQNTVVFAVFELINGISKVEIAIYNYLKRRGWK